MRNGMIEATEAIETICGPIIGHSGGTNPSWYLKTEGGAEFAATLETVLGV